MALTSFSPQGALGPLQTLAQVNSELARQREQRRRERQAARQQALRTVGQVAGMAIGGALGATAGGVGAVPGAMAGGALGSTAGGLVGGQGLSAGEMLNTGLTVANMQQQAEARQQAQQQRTAEQEMIRGALQPTQDYQRQLSLATAAPKLNAERQAAMNLQGAYALAQDEGSDFTPAPSALGALAIPEQPTALPMPPPGGALDPRTMSALQAAKNSSDPMKSLMLWNAMRGALAPPPPPELTRGRPGDVFYERPQAGGLREVASIPGADKPVRGISIERVEEGKLQRYLIHPETGADIKYIGEARPLPPAPGKLTGAQKIEAANKLRDDFNKTTKIAQDAMSFFNTIAVNADRDSPAGDLALLTAMAKLNDPNSVVRPSEFAEASKIAGLAEQAQAMLGKWAEGTRLTPAMRQDILETMGRSYAYFKDQQDGILKYYRGIAGEYEIPPGQVGRLMQLAPEADKALLSYIKEVGAAAVAPADAREVVDLSSMGPEEGRRRLSALPEGTVVKLPDGSQMVVRKRHNE